MRLAESLFPQVPLSLSKVNLELCMVVFLIIRKPGGPGLEMVEIQEGQAARYSAKVMLLELLWLGCMPVLLMPPWIIFQLFCDVRYSLKIQVLGRTTDLSNCRSCSCVLTANKQEEFWFLLWLVLDQLASSVGGGAQFPSKTRSRGAPSKLEGYSGAGSQKDLHYSPSLRLHNATISPTTTTKMHSCPPQRRTVQSLISHFIWPQVQVCRWWSIWDRLGPGTWDPLLQCWPLDISLSNRIRRNYKGLKITVCMSSWGKLWTTKYKKAQTQLPLMRCQEQKQGTHAWSLHTAPPRGWGDHLSHTSGSHRPTPILTPFKEPGLSTSGSEQGNLLPVLAPLCYSRSPSKALPEFLVCSLINFYWLKSPRTQVGNTSFF